MCAGNGAASYTVFSYSSERNPTRLYKRLLYFRWSVGVEGQQAYVDVTTGCRHYSR